MTRWAANPRSYFGSDDADWLTGWPSRVPRRAHGDARPVTGSLWDAVQMERIWSESEGGTQTTHLRILLSSWGLHVDLTATLGVADATGGWPAGIIPVSNIVGLNIGSAPVLATEAEALISGLRMMLDHFPADGGPEICVVEIESVRMLETDGQPEALTIAAAVWVADLLKVDRPTFEAAFDHEGNRYEVTSRNVSD